ncbi:MAG TPA: leucyl aminopeptidase [Streptosporangiales bacterium]
MSAARAARSASSTDSPATDIDLAESITAAGPAEALVVAVLDDGTGLSLPDATRDMLEAAGTDALVLQDGLAAVRAGTDVGASTRIPAPPDVAADMVLAVGLGSSDDATGPEILRRAAGAAARSLAGVGHAVFALPAETAEPCAAVALGAELGAYTFGRYRTTDKPADRAVRRITVVSPAAGEPEVVTAFTRSRHVAAGVALARDLVNTAPRDQSPVDLADAAVEAGRRNGLEVEVLDEVALASGGYGALLGVGQGSTNPPRLVRIAYTHPEARSTLAICGKGITFDSGGLSLKPNDSMATMKLDMAGAAAVLGALVAISRIGLQVDVVGYLACAENMPGGGAQRPSDVVSSYGGTTIEVLNTDAEGRLVLADAIGRAVEDGPDLLLDVATLTAAQLVALGYTHYAVMGDEGAVDQVLAAAERAGERAWPMPLPPDVRRSLDSDVADIANVPGHRWAGMLAAGVFLKEFVPDGLPWAHLDIPGPAWSTEARDYTPKGGTGAPVRSLVQLAEDLATHDRSSIRKDA